MKSKYQPGDVVEWTITKKPPVHPYTFFITALLAAFTIGLLIGHFKKAKQQQTLPDLPPDEQPASQETFERVNMAFMDFEPKAPQNAAKVPYSQFEIAMWYLKAHESFRPYEYDDGQYPSKGFGLNLTPEHTRWASKILGYPARSRDWTYKEGQTLLRAYWDKKREKFLQDNKHLKPHQQTALLLHAYNTGKYDNVRGCCGAKIGCGRKGSGKNARIREAHNKRREFEWRLYNDKVTHDEITAIRQRAIAVEAKWSKH
jgi:hypothetical protein